MDKYESIYEMLRHLSCPLLPLSIKTPVGKARLRRRHESFIIRNNAIPLVDGKIQHSKAKCQATLPSFCGHCSLQRFTETEKV